MEEIVTGQHTIKFSDNPFPCTSCNTPCNFIVHVDRRVICSMYFWPQLNYYGENSCPPQRSTYAFHLLPGHFGSVHTINEAVRYIMYSKVGLRKYLELGDILFISRYVHSGKTELLDLEKHSTCEVFINIAKRYVFEDILPLGTLVRLFEVKEGSEEDCCAVCLDGFTLEGFTEGGRWKESVYKTCCSHMFHVECIGEWLTKKGDCPLCRFQLVPDPHQTIYIIDSVEESLTDEL